MPFACVSSAGQPPSSANNPPSQRGSGEGGKPGGETEGVQGTAERDRDRGGVNHRRRGEGGGGSRGQVTHTGWQEAHNLRVNHKQNIGWGQDVSCLHVTTFADCRQKRNQLRRLTEGKCAELGEERRDSCLLYENTPRQRFTEAKAEVTIEPFCHPQPLFWSPNTLTTGRHSFFLSSSTISCHLVLSKGVKSG